MIDTVKRWQGSKSCWHYVQLSPDTSSEISVLAQGHQSKRRGWGAVRVQASIGAIQWQTSIFPAFDHGCYALFLKADIRKLAQLQAGDVIQVDLQLLF